MITNKENDATEVYKQMKQRIITAVIAFVIILPFIIIGGVPFMLFAGVLAAIGLYELMRMRKLTNFFVPAILSLLGVITILSRFEQDLIPYINWTKFEAIMLLTILLLAYTVLSKNEFTFDDAGFMLISSIYVGIGFLYLTEARFAGINYLLFIFFVVWSTDSGAYFVGRSLGKHKLWPVISPNKTIEGAIGGILSGCIIALIFQLVHPFNVSIIAILGIALLISIAGQIGDLVESAFKRHYNVKDSGNIMPGHGGILDRLDSLLFVVPLLHLIHFI